MLGRDSRRIQGPSESKPVSQFIKENHESDSSSERLLRDENGLRADGRRLDEIRPVYLRTGVVDQAKGSSYYETNGAKVTCAVYGPRESQRKMEFSTKGKLVCEVTFAPFSLKIRQQHGQESKTKGLSNLLETALQCAVCLESFPKSQVEIFVKVIQDSGDIHSAVIVAASLALADAGIEMYDLVSACSMVFDQNNIALDPTTTEISSVTSRGTLTVGYLPSLNLISCIHQNGAIEPDRDISCIKKCIEGCIRMHGVMQESLLAGFQRKQQQMLFQQKYT